MALIPMSKPLKSKLVKTMSDNSSAIGEKFRILHTMLRVRDLDKSLDFYTRLLGMHVLRRLDFSEGKFSLVFVGYGPEDTHPAIELTHNWGKEEDYQIGEGFGHVALGSNDIYAICASIAAEGGKITRQPGPMMHGKTHIAFVEDPDGYKVELVDLNTMFDTV